MRPGINRVNAGCEAARRWLEQTQASATGRVGSSGTRSGVGNRPGHLRDLAVVRAASETGTGRLHGTRSSAGLAAAMDAHANGAVVAAARAQLAGGSPDQASVCRDYASRTAWNHCCVAGLVRLGRGVWIGGYDVHSACAGPCRVQLDAAPISIERRHPGPRTHLIHNPRRAYNHEKTTFRSATLWRQPYRCRRPCSHPRQRQFAQGTPGGCLERQWLS